MSFDDVRFAARGMWKNPGFTAVAVLALALGIGANTAIFSVVNQVLLQNLPYKDSDRLVALMRTYRDGRSRSTSVPKFFAWKTDNPAFSGIAAYDFEGPGVSLGGDGVPEQVKAIHASAGFFDVFGVTPGAGRFFSEEEDRPGGPRVAVISNGLWKRRFGGDPNIAGRTVLLSGAPYTVIGVANAGFQPDPPADIWLPLQADPNSTNQGHYLLCAARLRPGVSLATATAAMQAAAERFRRQYPKAIGRTESAGAFPLRDVVVGSIQRPLLVVLGAVVFVLLIGCANVANLLLARASAREREIAIRAALGAGRGRLVRQLLTESVMLGLAGGVAGLLLGHWGFRLLLTMTPEDMPRLAEMTAFSGLDWRVLLFTLGVSLATGVVFGLAPVFQTSQINLNATLKEGMARTSSNTRQMRARGALVAVEMALSLVLLVGAGLLIRSAAAMRAVQPGFDPHNVLVFKTAFSAKRFETTDAVEQFSKRMLLRLESLPGVERAAGAMVLPVEGQVDLSFRIEGRAASEGRATGDEQWRPVSPHYFDVLSIPLLRGRVFTERDDASGPPVVLVNEAFARKYWPKGNPIGQQITIGRDVGPEFADPTREVVGVVANVRVQGLDNPAPPVMYLPLAQLTDGVTAFTTKVVPYSWVVRTSVDPLTLSNQVRREAAAVDPTEATFDFRTMEQVLGSSLSTRRFLLSLLGVFAAIAMALAATGLYGVMAYLVEQRTREIGIRIALGADRGAVVRLVVGRGMALSAVGIGIGLAVAYALARVMKSMLFEVQSTDPVTFVSVSAVLAFVALLASWVPAYRAARIDPVNALRCE